MFVNECFGKSWSLQASSMAEKIELERIMNVLRSTPPNHLAFLASAVESHHLAVRLAMQSLQPGSRVGSLVYPDDFRWPSKSQLEVPSLGSESREQSSPPNEHPSDNARSTTN